MVSEIEILDKKKMKKFPLFSDILFSKIMPNICRLHAMSIHKIQQFPSSPFIFSKLILYPHVRDSMTQLTLILIRKKN